MSTIELLNTDASWTFKNVSGISRPIIITFGNLMGMCLMKRAEWIFDIFLFKDNVASFDFFANVLIALLHSSC